MHPLQNRTSHSKNKPSNPIRSETLRPKSLRRLGLPWVGLFRSLTLMATGGAVVVALVAGVGVMRLGDRFWTDIKSVFTAPPPEPEVDVRSLVVQQVREVSELSTAVFTMEAVVPTRQERTLAGLKVGATTLLYIARGEVRAGVDLSQLTPGDVTVSEDRNSIELRLPAPQILDQKIDVKESQVYDYDRGFLGLGPDSAIQLQSLASETALTKIATAACQENILGQANQRAKGVVTQLLMTAGFQQVTVQTQAAIGCGEAPSAAIAPAAPALPQAAPPLQSAASDMPL